MNKQLWFRREVKVDNDVEHRNINAARRQIGHHKNACQLVLKLGDSDLTRCRIQRTVRIRARDVGFRQHLTFQTILHIFSKIFNTILISSLLHNIYLS